MAGRNGKRGKTMLIGLDGATYTVIRPAIERGELPNLRTLMEQGSSGILKSTYPPVSPVAWTSCMTGANPAKHGILDFMEPIVNGELGIRLNNRNDCKAKPIWRHLEVDGYKSVIVNVPMTYPPDKLDGVMVSGMDAPGPDSAYTYPPEIKQALNQAADKYILDVTDTPDHDSNPEKFLTQLLDMVDSRRKAVKHLMETVDWDFFMIVFMASDRAQHSLWEHMDPTHPRHVDGTSDRLQDGIPAVYRALDEAVGEILERLDDDTNVVLMSDHGFGPVHTSVALEDFLIDKGYLALKKGTRSPSVVQKALNFFEDVGRQISRRLGSYRGKNFQFFKTMDWENTKAFFVGSTPKVFIAQKGRFPEGCVEPGEEYEAVRAKLIEDLKALRDPKTNEPVIEEILLREDIYTGKAYEVAADLIIRWKPGYDTITRVNVLRNGVGTVRAPLFSPHRMWSGDHMPDGIFAVRAPGVKKNLDGLTASIMDICPTILHMMGVKVPASIDGEVLERIFDEDYLSGHAPEYYDDGDEGVAVSAGEGYSDEEETQIEERLKGLGYLD